MHHEEPTSRAREGVESAALAHAVRHWAAETDAASRLATRSNTVLTLIVAVLGYGIWHADSVDAVQPAGLRWTLRALFGLSLLLVLASLVLLLVPPHGQEIRSLPGTALALRMPAQKPKANWTRADVLLTSRRRTEAANRRLVRQNEWVQSRINEAQALFLSAGLCVVVAALCYFTFHA